MTQESVIFHICEFTIWNPLRFLELSDLGRHAAATVKAPELPSISPEARCNAPTVTRVKFLGDTKQLEGVRELELKKWWFVVL